MNNRTETEILSDMLTKGENIGLLTVDEEIMTNIQQGRQTENQYVMFLSCMSQIYSEQEYNNYNNYLNMNLNTARGEALDNLGRLVHVTRYTGEPATCSITITKGQLTDAVTIPSGTSVVLNPGNADYPEYVLQEDVSMPSGVATVTTIIESTVHGFQDVLPVGAVVGILGVQGVTASNTVAGLNGRDIEEDDDYRERIRQWSSVNSIGTLPCLEDYLDHYTGIDSYKLIPRYDGVGTLKIVCDTLSSMTSQIASDVYNNCMLATDFMPVVVLPSSVTISKIRLNVVSNSNLKLSTDELSSLLKAQVGVYVSGGITRGGASYRGLGIGEDFSPSLLVQYLLSEFSELDNVYLERWDDTLGTPAYVPFNEVFSISDTMVLEVNEVEVRYD